MAPQPSSNDLKNLDQEIRQMISSLTTRLQLSHKPGTSTDEDHDQGASVITLSGTNLGATMRGDVDNTTPQPQQEDDDDAASHLVNSNFQAINNSIMLGGTYKANDPGVHMDIVTDHDDLVAPKKKGRKGRRGSHHHVDSSHTDTEKD